MNKLIQRYTLSSIDMGAKEIWNELSEEEKKQISFYP